MMALSAGGCWGSWHPFQPRWWGPAMALMPRMAFLLRYSLGSKGSSQCASQCVLILTWIYGSQKKIKSLEEDFTSRPIYFISFIIVNLLSLCSCCLNKTNDHRWVSTDSFSWTRRTAALEMLGQIPLLQTSFVALSRKTEPISASQALWESFFLPIMSVALFNPHCMQSITGGLLTFSIVKFLWKTPCLKQPLEGGACAERVRSFHPWVPSSICMPCALWFGDRNLLQEEPQGVYPHQETMSKVETTNTSVMNQGTFVAWKIYGCPF